MKQLVKKMIPKLIREKLISFGVSEMRKRWKSSDDKIKKYELSRKHHCNLQTLTNRKELVSVLPKNCVIAEIGVNKGDFSDLILHESKPKKLHLIDRWDSEQYPNSLKFDVQKKFYSEIATKQIEINRGDSVEVSRTFEDNYFDWIYIDTSHSYTITLKELESYRSKVKKDGIIAGHDFIIGNWNEMVRYGVIEAVYEFCVKHDWEIIFLTMENAEHPSFALKKITDS